MTSSSSSETVSGGKVMHAAASEADRAGVLHTNCAAELYLPKSLLTSLQELRYRWQHKRSCKKLLFSCAHPTHYCWIRPFASSATSLARSLSSTDHGCHERSTILPRCQRRAPCTNRDMINSTRHMGTTDSDILATCLYRGCT